MFHYDRKVKVLGFLKRAAEIENLGKLTFRRISVLQSVYHLRHDLCNCCLCRLQLREYISGMFMRDEVGKLQKKHDILRLAPYFRFRARNLLATGLLCHLYQLCIFTGSL